MESIQHATDRDQIPGIRKGVCIPKLHWVVSVLVWLPMVGLTQRASAQQMVATDPTLEEIVVTAQKREENAQDVPIGITVFASEPLQSRAFSNIADLGELIPNAEFDSTSPFSGSSSVLSPFIRGIGQNDFAFNLEPGVGVYVDGVYYARTIGATVDLLDLERIEVLKGPQGTLFGRNTIGGAISVITRPPSTEFNYQGDLTVGQFDRLDVRGAFDLPLVPERLYSQFAFSSKRRDGYQHRKAFPGVEMGDELFFNRAAFAAPHDAGGEHQDHVRGKFLWVANDTLEVTVAGDYSRVDEQGTPSTLVATNAVNLITPDADDLQNPAFGLQPNGVPTLATIYNTCIGNSAVVLGVAGFGEICDTRDFFRGGKRFQGPALAGVNTDGDPTNDRTPFGNQFLPHGKDGSFATGSNFSKLENAGLALTAAWDFTPGVELKSISAVRNLGAKFGLDLDGSSINIGDTSFNTNQKQYSQEFQLIGKALGERLGWVLGAYYFHERGQLVDFVSFAEGTVQVLGKNNFKNESFAEFLNLNYSLTDALRATLGLRNTAEDKKFEGRQRDENNFPFKARANTLDGDDGLPGLELDDFPDCVNGAPCDTRRIYPIGNQHKDFQDLSVRLALDYSLTDASLGYVSYSQGVKSGGWTTRLLIPEPNPNVAPDFDEEKADSYEIGLKSRLFANRLQLNTAAFQTNYDQIQVTVARGVSPTFENAGAGLIRGLEAEFEGILTNSWRVSGGVGVLDAHYTKLAPGAGVDRHDRFVNTPNFSLNLTSNYTFPVPALNGSFRWMLGYDHKSNVANDAENNPLLKESHINVLNTAVSYAPSKATWEVTLGMRNLTDERYVVSGIHSPGGGFTSVVFSRPREWYLTVAFRR